MAVTQLTMITTNNKLHETNSIVNPMNTENEMLNREFQEMIFKPEEGDEIEYGRVFLVNAMSISQVIATQMTPPWNSIPVVTIPKSLCESEAALEIFCNFFKPGVLFETDIANLAITDLSKLFALGQYYGVSSVEEHIISYLEDVVQGYYRDFIDIDALKFMEKVLPHSIWTELKNNEEVKNIPIPNDLSIEYPKTEILLLQISLENLLFSCSCYACVKGIRNCSITSIRAKVMKNLTDYKF